MHVTATKEFEWDMAHRLGNGYPGKCKHLHGHRYRCQVTCKVAQLDRYGMAIDFGDIKRICNGWVQEHLDHATLVSEADVELQTFLANSGQRHYTMPLNTTAENIVSFLADIFAGLLASEYGTSIAGCPVQVVHVRLYETPTSYVDWGAL